MYDSIASIFKAFVPMFDKVLSCLLNDNGPELTLEIPDMYRGSCDLPEHPAVPKSIDLEPSLPLFTLKGRTVQVIVKIAEIHLTPDNPSFPGGSWHVEGSDSEQIVATGLYYFGCENITESRLWFRVIVNEPEYEQNDETGMAAMYGLERDEMLVQSLGGFVAVEDRCVVFPNTLQHRVLPFELADKTKPGVRKILAFFIVDPSKTIPSSSVIPPQQEAWIHECNGAVSNALRELPETVVQQYIQKFMVDGRMTLEEAKENREQLMNVRRDAMQSANEYGELMFSLCEH